jgi:ubiquinone/menaquinone biosynthesis C-methylase UbiE/predicted transcriptional regulator
MKPLDYFKALADITRLRLFTILLNHELSVNEIAALMRMGQSRISRHLRILTDSGLLSSRRDGLCVFYRAVNTDENGSFINSVKELLKDNNELTEDLNRASNLIAERKVRTKRFFDSIADDWDRLERELLGGFDLNGEILERVSRCEIAADLGCGTGHFISTLKKRADIVIGVDSSTRMLDIARRRFMEYGAGIDLRLGELEHLPLRDEETDFALINMVLHHLSEPQDCIREVNRILKSGKEFIIVEFAKHNNEMMRSKYGDRWLGFYEGEIESWLGNSGFELIERNHFKLESGMRVILLVSVKRKDSTKIH